jgi:hypothetical protein
MERKVPIQEILDKLKTAGYYIEEEDLKNSPDHILTALSIVKKINARINKYF